MELEGERNDLAALHPALTEANKKNAEKDEAIRHHLEKERTLTNLIAHAEQEHQQVVDQLSSAQATIVQLRESLINKALEVQAAASEVTRKAKVRREQLTFPQLLEQFEQLDSSHDKLQRQMQQIVEALKNATRHAEVTHQQLKRERADRLELEGQLDASNATIAELRQKIASLQLELEAIRNAHNEEILRMNRGKQHLLEELGHLQCKVTAYKDRENKLQISVRNLQSQLDSVTTTANDATRRFKMAQQDLEMEREEKHKLAEQLDQIRRDLKDRNTLIDKLQMGVKNLSLQLDTEVKSAARKIAALEEKLADALAQLEKSAGLRQQVQNLQHELDLIKSDTGNSSMTIKNLQNQLDAERSERIQANQAFEQLRSHLEEVDTKHQLERQEMERAKNDLENQLAALRRENASLQERLDHALQQLGGAEDQSTTLQRLNAQLIEANQRAAETESKLKLTENQLLREREEHNTLAAALDQTKASLTAANKALEQLQESFRNLQQQRDIDSQRHAREKQTLDNEIAELQRQLNAAKSEGAFSSGAQATIAKLRDQNQEYLGQIENLQKDVNRERNARQETLGQLQNANTGILELQHRIRDLEGTLNDIGARHGGDLKALRDELADVKARLKTAKDYNEELEGRVQLFSESLRHANSTAEDQHLQIESLRKRLAAGSGGGATEEFERLRGENEQLNNERARILKELRANKQAADGRISALTGALQTLEAQIQQFLQTGLVPSSWRGGA